MPLEITNVAYSIQGSHLEFIEVHLVKAATGCHQSMHATMKHCEYKGVCVCVCVRVRVRARERESFQDCAYELTLRRTLF